MEKKKYELGKRKYVLGGIACVIIFTYILRLFTLQLLSEDFKKNADSNAFLKHILFPARGAIIDRNGKLLVYNQPAYDIMVVIRWTCAIPWASHLSGTGAAWMKSAIRDAIRAIAATHSSCS